MQPWLRCGGSRMVKLSGWRQALPPFQTHTCGAHATGDTGEASVWSPCLALLPNPNAVVPAPSMLLGSPANHVLRRIQVSSVMEVPSYCQLSEVTGEVCSLLSGFSCTPSRGVCSGQPAFRPTSLPVPHTLSLQQCVYLCRNQRSSILVTLLGAHAVSECLLFAGAIRKAGFYTVSK